MAREGIFEVSRAENHFLCFGVFHLDLVFWRLEKPLETLETLDQAQNLHHCCPIPVLL